MTQTTIPMDAVGELAGSYFGEQYHCAEAVAKAVLETLGHNPDESVACATAFGGGFGKSFQEACGALSGALIAIGQVHGRRRPGECWELPAALGASIRDRFAQSHGATHCQTLREHFGENQMTECRAIVRNIACETLRLLQNAEDGDLP